MRHVTGFVLALVLSAALYFGAGWGVARIIALHGPRSGLGHPLTSTHGLIAVAAVLAAGLLLGICLAAPRVSPLAAGLPGLVLLGWSGLVIAHSGYALRYLPLAASQATAGAVYLLVHGVLALLGAAMIIPLLVPSRWRRAEVYDEVEEEDFSVPAALGLVP
jgi:hypothetical protein